jgi:peptidoglycan/LPS O-acetylase OafA/YrhL
VQTKSPFRFLRKRVLRIYPGFLLAAVISCFVAGYIGAAVRSTYFQAFPYAHFFKMLPILEVPDIPGIFVRQAYPTVNGSTWTLRFEFACYLSMLLSIYLIRPKSGKTALIIAISMLAAYAAFMLGHINPRIIISDPRSFVRLAAFFYSGTILYYYRQYIMPSRWVALAILWIGLMLAGRFIVSHDVRYVVDTIVTMTVGASALLSAGFTPRVETGLGNRDYSYGVYLYGWPVTKCLVYFLPAISPWPLFFGSLAGATLLASVSWHFVERPALAKK